MSARESAPAETAAERYTELTERIRLLSRGILPVRLGGREIIGGSGVGAGPQGKRFFHCSGETGVPLGMISVPVFPGDHHLAPYALETKFGDKSSTIIAGDGIVLKAVPIERFIGKTLAGGASIVKDGLSALHCYATYTMVPAWKCKHPETGDECRYCQIDSVARGERKWPDLVPVEHLVEALEIAQKVERLRTITMTTGTFGNNDDVVRRYMELIRAMRAVTDLSFHVQFEPVSDLGLLEELSGFADSVGIFIEIFDEEIRKDICPGKFRSSSREDYLRNWEEGVRCFGWGNVSTTCLIGFGEDLDRVLGEMEKFSAMGVRTSILFARFSTHHLKGRVPSYLQREEKEIVDFYLEAARILERHDLGYAKGHGSGCIGCGGCNAMMEASACVRLEG
jgi:hypothetical protein